jgi:hypothetical protein
METAPLMRRSLQLSSLSKEYVVVASLPKNSVSLASKAQEAGADAILLNIDGDDSARPNHLGSYDLHDAYINDVISTLSIPCGIFIGGAKPVTSDYWERVMASDFGFVEMFAHQMPLFVLSDSRVGKVIGIATGYILEQVKQLSQMDGVLALDSATVPTQARGTPFSAFDYATLGVIAGLSAKPVLLRTQKRLARRDVEIVMKLGVKGLIVDPAILSGTEEAYREELASLCPRRPESGQQ